jgi:hypothetical protein
MSNVFTLCLLETKKVLNFSVILFHFNSIKNNNTELENPTEGRSHIDINTAIDGV